MAFSSISSIRKNFKYHVFLSFRGEDTRKTFVDHLYTHLKKKGIHTFRDNEELEKGKQIDELFKAIEESRFFIIVFSQNYASSSWCLKEVTKIMECQDEKEQIAYPLFYDVEPSDIRYQTGPVGRAIAKHKTNEQITKWEKALESAGNLVGWNLKNIANGHEAEAIKIIVENISLKLRSIHLRNDENLVGMESRMQVLESSLGVGLDDKVRMIGIKGMGGIGKTTLARAIFDKISSRFEGSIFVEDVREVSKKKGLESLQERILSGVLNDEQMSVGSVYVGKEIMKMRLPYKKVLLVLDDVDDTEQLEALAGAWFKDGSRIIITTRDEHVLKVHGVNTNWIHDVTLLSNEEAIRFFSRYAFKSNIPDEGYEDLSSEIVKYAAGLPLTLKVLGSFLLGRKNRAWKNTLDKLKEIPPQKTLEVLEISYQGLEDEYRQIFLDVACFMKGEFKESAIRMLESRGFHAIIGLEDLEERSLITIRFECLAMHDSIQELGRNIVRRGHPSEPNKHSRLWIPKEINTLLSDNVGTENTTCIRLELTDLSPEIIMKGLGNLTKLRFLQISTSDDDCPHNNWMFDQGTFPNTLQSLNWWRYPGRSLPQAFRASNLIGLELPGSRITKLWESGEGKVLSNLRFLNLSCSKLTTFDLGITPNLERLDLSGCRDLTRPDVPAGGLKSLVYVNLHGCSQFNSFSFIQQLESLELLTLPGLKLFVKSLPRDACANLPKLSFDYYYYEEEENSQKAVSVHLQPCTKFESVSGSFFDLQHLRHFRLVFCDCIPELPNDLDQLANLETLVIEFTLEMFDLDITHIKCLPDSICKMKNLKSLVLYCDFLEELPRDLGQLVCLENLTLSSERIECLPDSICMMENLKSLKLSSERIECLPDSICMMENLKSLKLYCDFLEELPRDLGQLVCLEKLTLRSERIECLPDSICMMENLKSLELYCDFLEELPRDLGQLVCLEKLTLWSERIECLPDSICMMENLKSLELRCRLLKKLPRDLGQLECLEELCLPCCASLKDIPNSICNMKRLEIFSLSQCSQVENLPEELGSLECLKELNIIFTGIKHLPPSISLLGGLRIIGTRTVLQSCVFATEIQTADHFKKVWLCYIQAVDNTKAGTRVREPCYGF